MRICSLFDCLTSPFQGHPFECEVLLDITACFVYIWVKKPVCMTQAMLQHTFCISLCNPVQEINLSNTTNATWWLASLINSVYCNVESIHLLVYISDICSLECPQGDMWCRLSTNFSSQTLILLSCPFCVFQPPFLVISVLHCSPSL